MAIHDQAKVTKPATVNAKFFEEPPKKSAKTRLLRIKDWERLAQASHYSPEALASLCEISFRQPERFFGEYFGKTLRLWLRE